MKKKFTLMVFAFLSLYVMASVPDIWDGTTITPFDEVDKGSTEDAPILIESAAQLAYLSKQVAAGNLYEKKFFKLTTDIDLNDQEWLPIGYHNTNAKNKHFKGYFNGNGHKIFNLSISQAVKIPDPTDATKEIDISTYSLFGAVEGSGRGMENGGVYIKNLGIQSGNITVGATVAGIVSWASGTVIRECYNKAKLEGTGYVSGVAAYTVSPSVDVINCYNMGDLKITTTATSNKAIGGIIGATTTAYISNSYNFGNVTVNGSIPDGTWGGITGTFQSTREPINTYYVETAVNNGNKYGTKYTETQMLAPVFVTTINNDQEPIKWISDKNLLNFGLPILYWEDETQTGLNNVLTKQISLRNYPNPVTDFTTVVFDNEINGLVTLEIYDITGKKVMEAYKGMISTGTQSLNISVKRLSKGIYTYVLTSQKYIGVNKMIIE